MNGKSEKPTVSLIVFCLNEIDGLKAIMPKIRREWYDELIIVDGWSTDGSFEYAQQKGYHIFRQKERGAGAAFLESTSRAKGDIIIVFSPDGNSMPEKIPEVVKKMGEGYDMVIVSRYLDGAKSYDDDPVTAFGNRMFTWLINVVFGGRVTDSLVMYRAFKRELVKELEIDTHTVSWGTQMLARALRKKKRIGEIPGDEPSRIGGVRKMSPIKNGLSELRMIWRELIRKG